MFPISLNFAAISIGAACDAWATYMDVLLGQGFGVFGLTSPFSFQTFCDIIDIGEVGGLLPIF